MALKFSASSRLEAASAPQISGAAGLTFSAWLRLDGSVLTKDQVMVAYGGGFDSSAPLLLWRDAVGFNSGRTDTLSIQLRTDAGTLRAEGSTGLLDDTNWRHVAGVFWPDLSDGVRLYADGVMDSNTSSSLGSSALVSESHPLNIARSYTGKDFVSELAEVAIFKAPLTSDEIQSLAEGLSPLALTQHSADLVVYQGLVRHANHPLAGTPLSLVGAPTVTRHPRYCSLLRGYHPRSTVQRVHRFHAAAASAEVAGSDLGQAAASGLAASSSGLAGEVLV